MSSATLASPRTRPVQPDLVRVAALSVAMTVNVTVFIAASRPLPPMAVLRAATPDLGVRLIDRPKPTEAPPPPPLDVRPLRHQPVHALPAAPPSAVAPHVTDEGHQVTVTVAAPTIAPPAVGTAPAVMSGEPVEASLAYRSAPLSFPIQAIRQHMRGTVLLRVLVDESGKPAEVTVEQSSGYPLLDRSAREQVMAGWRFQPASRDGHAVRAWARVPVTFELRGR
jgi:protein TonB